jgi:hypothetical protein
MLAGSRVNGGADCCTNLGSGTNEKVQQPVALLKEIDRGGATNHDKATRYGSKPAAREKERFVDVPATLTREFQQLVGLLFQICLAICFPYPLLEESCTDLRNACTGAWDDFKLWIEKSR